MKKILIIILTLISFALIFWKISLTNKNYPKDEKLILINKNEAININNLLVKYKGYEIENEKDEDNKAIKIEISLTNKNKDRLNFNEFIKGLNFYQDFNFSIVQNLNFKNHKNRFYPDKSYDISKDFILKPEETKDYSLYFILYNSLEDTNNYLLINNENYRSEYDKEFKRGKLLYKAIKVGEKDG